MASIMFIQSQKKFNGTVLVGELISVLQSMITSMFLVILTRRFLIHFWNNFVNHKETARLKLLMIRLA